MFSVLRTLYGNLRLACRPDSHVFCSKVMGKVGPRRHDALPFCLIPLHVHTLGTLWSLFLIQLYTLSCLFDVFETISFTVSSGWLRTHYVEQAGLQLI